MVEAPKGYESERAPVVDGGVAEDSGRLLRLYYDLRLANDGLDNGHFSPGRTGRRPDQGGPE